MRPTCTQALRGMVNKNYAKYVDPPLGWGHVIFMPKYGHCDVNQVTWALCLILIGRENFCCAVIGRYPVEPPILLAMYLVNSMVNPLVYSFGVQIFKDALNKSRRKRRKA